MELQTIYEDDKMRVVNKAAGLTIEQVGETLKKQFPQLEKLREEHRYGIVHRLDKDTSGLLLVAKTKQEFEQLQKQFAERKVEKQYICLVEGTFNQENGIIHTLLGRSPADRRKQKTFSLDEPETGRREAITEWVVLQNFKDFALLQVTPKTGRKHQIRAHMASISHPIAADKLYGFKNQHIPKGLERQFLHASFLKIKENEFASPLPEDLQEVLDTLSRKNDNAN